MPHEAEIAFWKKHFQGVDWKERGGGKGEVEPRRADYCKRRD